MRARVLYAGVGFAAVTMLCVVGLLLWPRLQSPERLLLDAVRMHAAGRFDAAERMAAAALNRDPALPGAARLAAESAAEQRRFAEAVAYLDSARDGDSTEQIDNRLLAARIRHDELFLVAEAEQDYRDVLRLRPDHRDANRELAKLLGGCGRMADAIPFVLALIRQRQITELLVPLARESGVIDAREYLERAAANGGNDPNVLTGLAWHAAAAEQSDVALGYLLTARETCADCSYVDAALGRTLLDAGRLEDLIEWSKHLPADAVQLGEIWSIRGRLAEQLEQDDAAIRCYWEAVRRRGELRVAHMRLAQLLARTGQDAASKPFADHVIRLQQLDSVLSRVLFSGPQESIEPLLELVHAYQQAGRLWEAFGWCLVAVDTEPSNTAAREQLALLSESIDRLELSLTADSMNPASLVDFSDLPLPNLLRQQPQYENGSELQSTGGIAFRSDAQAAGLDFQYFNGTRGQPQRRMFEFTGGGIAVLDYDRDGDPDAYFTQGIKWPPDASPSDLSDCLYRNLSGVSFRNVTGRAMVAESDFGQGATTGDFDSDGFPDLYVANIGINRLLHNNGDGTFSDVTTAAGINGALWTTSCLLADLNGDALPDLYDVNYLSGNDVFDRICRDEGGNPVLCMPYQFDAEQDRFLLNRGDGGFDDVTATALAGIPAGMGLGIAAWDLDGTGMLSLLIANDTTPNSLLVSDSARSDPPVFHDSALVAGIALNGDGKAEGCMGIALADVNGDGQYDVHVTNFLSESNTLYLAVSPGSFQDQTQASGLQATTLRTLGFGTQFLDADLDGRLEVFVANGHVDDLQHRNRPYRMRPQLFSWSGSQFRELDAAEAGAWIDEFCLGRSVVRIDWNRDGREDLMMGTLDTNTVLLTNTSITDCHYCALRLIGVQSNRDAIGATLSARIGERSVVRQQVAGDGYQAANERRIVIGIGPAEQIDELTVRWPSGQSERYRNLAADTEFILRESLGSLTLNAAN